MKKFEGWRTEELRSVASHMSSKFLLSTMTEDDSILYHQLIREIRNRRVKDELGQLKLNLEGPDNP